MTIGKLKLLSNLNVDRNRLTEIPREVPTVCVYVWTRLSKVLSWCGGGGQAIMLLSNLSFAVDIGSSEHWQVRCKGSLLSLSAPYLCSTSRTWYRTGCYSVDGKLCRDVRSVRERQPNHPAAVWTWKHDWFACSGCLWQQVNNFCITNAAVKIFMQSTIIALWHYTGWIWIKIIF